MSRLGSKHGLLEALVADSIRNMDQRARPYADSADALQGLLDVLTMLLDLAARDRHLLIAQAGTPSPAASGVTPDSELYATLQHLFTRAQRDGQIRPEITLDAIEPLITGMPRRRPHPQADRIAGPHVWNRWVHHLAADVFVADPGAAARESSSAGAGLWLCVS